MVIVLLPSGQTCDPRVDDLADLIVTAVDDNWAVTKARFTENFAPLDVGVTQAPGDMAEHLGRWLRAVLQRKPAATTLPFKALPYNAVFSFDTSVDASPGALYQKSTSGVRGTQGAWAYADGQFVCPDGDTPVRPRPDICQRWAPGTVPFAALPLGAKFVVEGSDCFRYFQKVTCTEAEWDGKRLPLHGTATVRPR